MPANLQRKVPAGVIGPEHPEERGVVITQGRKEHVRDSGDPRRASLGTPTTRLYGKWTSPMAAHEEGTATTGRLQRQAI